MDSTFEHEAPLQELPAEAEEKLQALLVEQRERRAQEVEQDHAKRQIWLAHHWPDEHERCATVGGRPVCRRCLTLYPISLAIMALSFLGVVPWPQSLDVLFIWLLCVPATLEFLAEKLLSTSYSAVRQVLVTALVAPALGRGFYHVVHDRSSWHFWGPVLVFGAIWGWAAVRDARNEMFANALQTSREFGPTSPQKAS